jgi:endoglucanase
VLGANAWGASFIIGDGSVFPHCPHHQVANLVGSQDGTPPALNGAAVEGPNVTPANFGAFLDSCTARSPVAGWRCRPPRR